MTKPCTTHHHACACRMAALHRGPDAGLRDPGRVPGG